LNSKNILIVTCQSLPHPSYPSTGGGLRSYMLGQALKACGHKVQFSIPAGCSDTSMDVVDGSICDSHSVDNVGEIVDKYKADVVLFCNWGLAAQAPALDVPVIVDVNGSLVLENHHRRHTILLDDALTKIKALEKADLVIAGSLAQKHYLIAWGLLAGMDPDLFPVEVVPFSLSPHLPIHKPPRDPVAVIAGYEWPWLDGQAAMKTVTDQMAALNTGHLMIYSGSPPYHDVIHGEDSKLDKIGNFCKGDLTRASLHDPVPFEALISVLRKSSFALDVWENNLERELAFPSRTIAYLWSGLPVITSARSSLAELITSYKAGWIVDGHDKRQLSDLVRSLLIRPEITVEYGANAQKLVREQLTWDKTIDPVARFCASPFKRDRHSPILRKFDGLQHKCNRLKIDLKNLEHKTTKKIEALEQENKLLGKVHRRPKGFSALKDSGQIQRKIRRWLIGWPLLIYLYAITVTGFRLHDLKQRWHRGRG
jgi:glycosyltransferase involved in cell wall biosynthesis